MSAPVCAGSVDAFSIDRAPPPGLEFSAETGLLSGLPTQATPAALIFTVTATNAGGECSAKLSLLVLPRPPALSYGPAELHVGDALVSAPVTNTGGPVETARISPTLPRGLALNVRTCTIEGTAAVRAGQASMWGRALWLRCLSRRRDRPRFTR
jgi:hypothetical protein